MFEIFAGKGSSKYKICITSRSIPKKELNKNIKKNAKVLIITDSGVPKKYIKNLKDSLVNKKVLVHVIKKGENTKYVLRVAQFLKKS